MKLKRGKPRRLVFTPEETELLGQVFQAIKDEIAGSDTADPVIERLFPAAYEDAEAAGEFRDITENDLRDERLGRLADCAEELETEQGDVPLDAEAVDRWLRVLNDARLVLGTRLQVSEEWDHQLEADDPEVAEKAVYLWLSAVQETIVQSL